MAKVKNVEVGVKFKHPEYGTLEVMKLSSIRKGHFGSDIWFCINVNSKDSYILADWVITDCEEVD